MTDEKKQEFTRRISQANQSELVVILYDLFFYYMDQANREYKGGNKKEFCQQVNFAQDVLQELIASLHMEQDLAKVILQVYLFVSGRLGLARGSVKWEPLEDADRLMKKLYETYKEDAKSDISGPVMSNAQTVYAGLTYGKNELNENYGSIDPGRGFFA